MKGEEMEVFGIMGMSLGTIGFIFALSALDKISKLEKKLEAAGVIEKNANQSD